MIQKVDRSRDDQNYFWKGAPIAVKNLSFLMRIKRIHIGVFFRITISCQHKFILILIAVYHSYCPTFIKLHLVSTTILAILAFFSMGSVFWITNFFSHSACIFYRSRLFERKMATKLMLHWNGNKTQILHWNINKLEGRGHPSSFPLWFSNAPPKLN